MNLQYELEALFRHEFDQFIFENLLIRFQGRHLIVFADSLKWKWGITVWFRRVKRICNTS